MIAKGDKVYGSMGSKFAKVAATVTGTYTRCQMDGCLGLRVWIKWPDGHVTKPCSKGIVTHGGKHRVG